MCWKFPLLQHIVCTVIFIRDCIRTVFSNIEFPTHTSFIPQTLVVGPGGSLCLLLPRNGHWSNQTLSQVHLPRLVQSSTPLLTITGVQTRLYKLWTPVSHPTIERENSTSSRDGLKTMITCTAVVVIMIRAVLLSRWKEKPTTLCAVKKTQIF